MIESKSSMVDDPYFAVQVEKPGRFSDPIAATKCLRLALIGLFASMVPALGVAVPLVGLAYGWRGWRATNSYAARLGVVLCIVELWMSYVAIVSVDLMCRIQ